LFGGSEWLVGYSETDPLPCSQGTCGLLSFGLKFSRSQSLRCSPADRFIRGSPPRGRIVDEFCSVENFAKAAQVSAQGRRGLFVSVSRARLVFPDSTFASLPRHFAGDTGPQLQLCFVFLSYFL